MTTPQRGIMTLTLLILLSGFLLIAMLFNDDLLRLYSSITAQRHRYVEQQLTLQQLSVNEKKRAVNSFPRKKTVIRFS